jgi:quercetin dioxygenase-like cupin family protein
MSAYRAALLLGSAAALVSMGAFAAWQMETKGVTTASLAALPLAPHFAAMDGKQLRMRLVTMAPGGAVAVHSHKDRPTLEYIMQGTVIEYRNGVAFEHRAGEVVLGSVDVSHGWENKGSEPVVLLPVDIVSP